MQPSGKLKLICQSGRENCDLFTLFLGRSNSIADNSLIIDFDEPELVQYIRQILVKEKYTVDVAYDGDEASEKIFVESYDLILLDIMLPKRDGFSIIQEIREKHNSTPVLMLTAKGTIEDKILGLDLGADDYLTKPFSMDKLLARIRVLLRCNNEHISSILQIGSVRINTASRETYMDEQLLGLTPKEFLILKFLLYNKNRAVSRFNIAEHVWGEEFDTYTMSNSLDVHINTSSTLPGQWKNWRRNSLILPLQFLLACLPLPWHLSPLHILPPGKYCNPLLQSTHWQKK